MSFLETGRALYLLAAICLGGIMVRLAAGSFYKRLIRESSNLALAKNRYLRALRQNAEDTYRINMGMNNTRVYLERQIYSLRLWGFSLQGFENLGGQLTLLCFLAGGAAAFLSYWNRSDNYYIVLYGVMGIFGGMATVFVDYGVNLEAKRQHLLTCLQDHVENVMWSRMERETVSDQQLLRRQRKNAGSVSCALHWKRPQSSCQTQCRTDRSQQGNSQGSIQDAREDRSGENWLQDLNPDQKRMLGEMLKGFIS